MAISQLTKIDMGSSLDEIGTFAFAGCTGITELRIPSSVKNIGYGAFSQCTNLTVSVPDTVGQIGQEAFYKVKFVEYKGKLGRWLIGELPQAERRNNDRDISWKNK